MLAEDFIGLKSKYSTPICISFNSSQSSTGKDVKLKGEYDLKNLCVNLIWSSLKLDNTEHYVLFKNENNKGWEMYQSFDNDITNFKDFQIEKGKNYKFKVHIFNKGSKVGNCNEINLDI
ncbi:hypothetical protein SDC9_152918 [bioreactor metagenome]|uniref:Fibronectin type-III domain-containing protein n=1 Tax=bioreactor metagenome TaxID=1076179 RepID=A0A645EUY9_9ZZZZ